jgi:hypothetical protein
MPQAERSRGSIPDEITGVFNVRNPSSHTMGLGQNQNLTEMSARNRLVVHKADLTAICEPIV